jgi:hypothetical protein
MEIARKIQMAIEMEMGCEMERGGEGNSRRKKIER